MTPVLSRPLLIFRRACDSYATHRAEVATLDPAIRWLTAYGVHFEQVRIDIIGVTPDQAGHFTVEHVRGVG